MFQNIHKNPLVNGFLYIGALLSLKFLFSVSQNSFLNLLSLIVSVVNIFLMYRFAIQYRDDHKEGTISYGGAFGFLFLLYFYGNIILSLIVFIYTQFINPDYTMNFVSQMMNMYDKMHVDVTNEMYTMAETIFKPLPFAFLNLLSGSIGAAFWAFVLAFFVKKDQDIFNNEEL